MLEEVLSQYNISPQSEVKPFGTGLINRTWLVKGAEEEYILQKINPDIFKKPEDISDNIESIDSYLKENHPHYLFVAPLKTKNGKGLVHIYPGEHYRIFPFVKESKTYDVVKSPEQAFEAAKQFGLFTRALSQFPLSKLKITLPGFHDLSYRYRQFAHACNNGNASRIKEAKNEIDFIHDHEPLVTSFEALQSSAYFKKRVTHHDTKISNVLFDKSGKGICVIDLDTIMPGYFISDVGDMLRTYLSPVSEEEKDLSKIEIREEYFKAILDGYLSQMHNELSKEEIKYFVYAGKFMIYMQAVRFLTDHLVNDMYYGAAYVGHNFARTKNQITLLKLLIEKERLFNDLVANRFV